LSFFPGGNRVQAAVDGGLDMLFAVSRVFARSTRAAASSVVRQPEQNKGVGSRFGLLSSKKTPVPWYVGFIEKELLLFFP
jgi:hypothetical protein